MSGIGCLDRVMNEPLSFDMAKRIAQQFGGSLYALADDQCEHVWGLLDQKKSLCNRYSRTSGQVPHYTGQICSLCRDALRAWA